jgi:hypothetical protein
VQVLSWSLQTGIAYDDLGAEQRALVDRLIPDYRAQMQLGLTEKIMRDWKAWSSWFPLMSPEVILAQMGEVGTYLSMLMRARQDILYRNYSYDMLWAVFAPRRDAPAPVDQDKTPWSRIHQRIYMRFIAPYGAKHDGVIQLRIVDDHGHHQQSSNGTFVAQARPNPGADACALSESLDCNQRAIGVFERSAGPSLAQMAFADSLGSDDLTPAILAQKPIPRPPPRVPLTGPILWAAVLLLILGVVAIAVESQSLTATTKTPFPEPPPAIPPSHHCQVSLGGEGKNAKSKRLP